MSRLTLSTREMAPEAIQWLVAGAAAKNGFLPKLIGAVPCGRTVRRSRDGGAQHCAHRVNPTENAR